MSIVKGIIFDYGGTIDTNGVHWGEVIWEQYIKADVAIEKSLFRDAYVYAERALAKTPIILPNDTFNTLLHKKINIQFEYLREQEHSTIYTTEKASEIAELCYSEVLDNIDKSREIIEELATRYPLVLVTNFYGNMPVVLKEFSLDKLFPTIIESSVVGLRKPDPALFALGVKAINLPPESIVVVGDSYRKDIHPARTLGCKAVWLKKRCWAEEDIIPGAEPNAIINSLEEFPPLITNM